MKTPKLQAHKIKRMIDTLGLEYTFKRDQLDQYKEPTGEKTDVANLKGIMHSSANYVSKSASDATIIQSKQSPQILTNDIAAKNLNINDEVTINNKIYKVSGVTDINCLGLAFDISLEVVL